MCIALHCIHKGKRLSRFKGSRRLGQRQRRLERQKKRNDDRLLSLQYRVIHIGSSNVGWYRPWPLFSFFFDSIKILYIFIAAIFLPLINRRLPLSVFFLLYIFIFELREREIWWRKKGKCVCVWRLSLKLFVGNVTLRTERGRFVLCFVPSFLFTFWYLFQPDFLSRWRLFCNKSDNKN